MTSVPVACPKCGKGLYWCVQEVGDHKGDLRIHCEDAQHCGIFLAFLTDTAANRERAGFWLTDDRINRKPKLDGKQLKSILPLR